MKKNQLNKSFSSVKIKELVNKLLQPDPNIEDSYKRFLRWFPLSIIVSIIGWAMIFSTLINPQITATFGGDPSAYSVFSFSILFAWGVNLFTLFKLFKTSNNQKGGAKVDDKFKKLCLLDLLASVVPFCAGISKVLFWRYWKTIKK